MSQQPAPVYACHGGERYHRSSNCSALAMGQDIHDYDCDCWGFCTHGRGWQITETTPGQARADGKTPCRVCLPEVALEPCGEDFGHQSIEVGGEWPNRRDVCARCSTTWWGPNGNYQRYVAWPCTTAVVLGLVPARRNTPLNEP